MRTLPIILAILAATTSASAQAEETPVPTPGASAIDAEEPGIDAEEPASIPALAEVALNTPSETGETEVVLVLAPEALRAEWTAALQIELAPRGVTVVPLDAPAGATSLIRDAQAQRAVLERGAACAVLVVMGDPAHSVRVLTPDADSARVAPVSVEADARTAALIAVSLWDEQPLSPAPVAAEPPWYRRTTAPTPTPLTEIDFEQYEPTPTSDGDQLSFSFRVGTGAFGYLNDRRAYVGSLIRLGGGLRFGLLELDLLVEGGAMLDHVTGQGDEAQPMARGCFGGGVATVDTTEFHLGLRVCAGYAEARRLERFGPPPFPEPPFAFDQGGLLLGVGGYSAVSFRVREGLRLFVRADLGAGYLEANPGLRIATTLSTILAVM
ncbi:MAG: hypothetical protein AB8I08_10415 [Sandaracinaceae bacterium]